MAGPDWQAQAACARHPRPDVFFAPQSLRTGVPVEERQQWEADKAEAKRVCGGCPVRLECMEHAIETGERHGWWGGLTNRAINRVRKGHALPRTDIEAARHRNDYQAARRTADPDARKREYQREKRSRRIAEVQRDEEAS